MKQDFYIFNIYSRQPQYSYIASSNAAHRFHFLCYPGRVIINQC